MTATGPIVVGVDGSEVSERALLWAAQRAYQSGATLRVVLARTHPTPVTSVAPQPVWPWPVVHQRDATAVSATGELLEKAVHATLPKDALPDLEFEVIDGDAASCLIEVARESDAALLVVGRRGLGGFKKLLLGSVSDECAMYAPCAVAVIGKPKNWIPEPVVVVGIDGSESSTAALAWAGSWARSNNARLDVVHAWEAPVVPADSLAGALPWLRDNGDALRQIADETLANALRKAEAEFADVACSGEVIEGYPSEVLTRVAHERRTSLLVVGTRGLGGFSSMLLGSVAHQCLRDAGYPVVVVRTPENG